MPLRFLGVNFYERERHRAQHALSLRIMQLRDLQMYDNSKLATADFMQTSAAIATLCGRHEGGFSLEIVSEKNIISEIKLAANETISKFPSLAPWCSGTKSLASTAAQNSSVESACDDHEIDCNLNWNTMFHCGVNRIQEFQYEKISRMKLLQCEDEVLVSRTHRDSIRNLQQLNDQLCPIKTFDNFTSFNIYIESAQNEVKPSPDAGSSQNDTCSDVPCSQSIFEQGMARTIQLIEEQFPRDTFLYKSLSLEEELADLFERDQKPSHIAITCEEHNPAITDPLLQSGTQLAVRTGKQISPFVKQLLQSLKPEKAVLEEMNLFSIEYEDVLIPITDHENSNAHSIKKYSDLSLSYVSDSLKHDSGEFPEKFRIPNSELNVLQKVQDESICAVAWSIIQKDMPKQQKLDGDGPRLEKKLADDLYVHGQQTIQANLTKSVLDKKMQKLFIVDNNVILNGSSQFDPNRSSFSISMITKGVDQMSRTFLKQNLSVVVLSWSLHSILDMTRNVNDIVGITLNAKRSEEAHIESALFDMYQRQKYDVDALLDDTDPFASTGEQEPFLFSFEKDRRDQAKIRIQRREVVGAAGSLIDFIMLRKQQTTALSSETGNLAPKQRDPYTRHDRNCVIDNSISFGDAHPEKISVCADISERTHHEQSSDKSFRLLSQQSQKATFPLHDTHVVPTSQAAESLEQQMIAVGIRDRYSSFSGMHNDHVVDKSPNTLLMPCVENSTHGISAQKFTSSPHDSDASSRRDNFVSSRAVIDEVETCDIFCDSSAAEDEELLVLLEATYRLQLSIQPEIRMKGAQFIFSPSTCAIFVQAEEIEHGFKNIFDRVSTMAFQYKVLYVIVRSQPEKSSSALLQTDSFLALNCGLSHFYSKSSSCQVRISIVNSVETAARAICEIQQQHGTPNILQMLDESLTTHELFLLGFACLNVLSTMLILDTTSISQLSYLSLRDLIAIGKGLIPQQSLETFLETLSLVNGHSSYQELSVPTIEESMTTHSPGAQRERYAAAAPVKFDHRSRAKGFGYAFPKVCSFQHMYSDFCSLFKCNFCATTLPKAYI